MLLLASNKMLSMSVYLYVICSSKNIQIQHIVLLPASKNARYGRLRIWHLRIRKYLFFYPLSLLTSEQKCSLWAFTHMTFSYQTIFIFLSIVTFIQWAKMLIMNIYACDICLSDNIHFSTHWHFLQVSNFYFLWNLK